MEREVLSSARYPVIGHVEWFKDEVRRGLDLASGSISLQSGWKE